MIRCKRIYDEVEEADGYRVLVDRVWPRSMSKEKARVDLWLKHIAPSKELRKSFGHDPEKWENFRSKYKAELGGKSEQVQRIKEIEKEKGTVSLLFSAKDREHNQAVVLKEYLEG